LNPLPSLVDRLAQPDTPANYSPQKATAVQDVTVDNGRATEFQAPVSRQEESSNGFNGDGNGVVEKDDGSEGGASLAVAATKQADTLLEQMLASHEREQLLTGQKTAYLDRDMGRSVDNHLDEEEEEEGDEEEEEGRENRKEDRGEDAETDPDLTEGDIAMPDVSGKLKDFWVSTPIRQ
jgi:hypothetical protein